MPFPPTPSNTPSNTPTPSVTPSVTPTITPSNTSCPNPTPSTTLTATPSITPSATVKPTIYVHTCLPATIPADGRVYLCAYATSEPGCTGTTTPVLDIVGFTDDVAVFVDGEYIPFVSMTGCVYLYPGQSCNCDCYYDFGEGLSGYSLSAVTYPIFTTGTTQANYVDDVDCYTPECSQCIATPTPTATPTMTPTPSITPSVTPTLTQTPTPSTTPPVPCNCYRFQNETGTADTVDYIICGGSGTSESIPAGQIRYRCVEGGTTPTSFSITITQCGSNCTIDDNCTNCT